MTRRLVGALVEPVVGGVDRDLDLNEWSGQYTSSLRQVAQALRDAASKATQNANAQEQTSNA